MLYRLAQCGSLLGPIAMLLACGCAGFRSPSDAELLRAMASDNAEDIESPRRLLQRDLETLDELHQDGEAPNELRKQFVKLGASEREAILAMLRLQSSKTDPADEPESMSPMNNRPSPRQSASPPARQPASPPTATITDKTPAAQTHAAQVPSAPSQSTTQTPTQSTPQTSAQSIPQTPTSGTRPVITPQVAAMKKNLFGDLIADEQKRQAQNSARPANDSLTIPPGRAVHDPNVRLAAYDAAHQPQPAVVGSALREQTANPPYAPDSQQRQQIASSSVKDVFHSGNVDGSSSPAVTPIVTDWRESMRETIRLLEKKVYYDNNSQLETQLLDTKLRLLYTIAEQKDLAVQPIFAHSEDMKSFWSHMIWALSSQLESNENLHPADRAADTLSKLRIAERMLAKASNQLEVKNLTFCEKVESFGRYAEYNVDAFDNNQLVLLYFEVENFVARKAKDGYETRLKGRYDIYDLAHRRVANREYPATVEVCRNYRRDFFMRYVVPMPSHLEPGRYTLQLTLEDELGDKVGQGTIEFEIRSSS